MLFLHVQELLHVLDPFIEFYFLDDGAQVPPPDHVRASLVQGHSLEGSSEGVEGGGELIGGFVEELCGGLFDEEWRLGIAEEVGGVGLG